MANWKDYGSKYKKDWIISRRLKMGLSQQQVADRIGVQRSNYSKFENSYHELNWKHFMKLMMVLEFTFGEILDGYYEDEKQAKQLIEQG